MIQDFINYILSDILNDFSADRVAIANIHSSSFKDYEYYSKVFSVTYEVCSPGIPSIKNIVKDIPITILERELEYYKDDILIVNPDKIDNQVCLEHLDSINASSIMNVLIKYREIITGILTIQYCKNTDNHCPSSLTKRAKAKLSDQVKSLSAFI